MIPDNYTDARVAAALDRLPAEFPKLLLEQYLLREEGAGVELPRSDLRRRRRSQSMYGEPRLPRAVPRGRDLRGAASS